MHTTASCPAQNLAALGRRWIREHGFGQTANPSSGGVPIETAISETGAFGIDVHVIARREMPAAEAFDVIAASQP